MGAKAKLLGLYTRLQLIKFTKDQLINLTLLHTLYISDTVISEIPHRIKIAFALNTLVKAPPIPNDIIDKGSTNEPKNP